MRGTNPDEADEVTMQYEAFPPERFYVEVSTEEQARDLLWRARCDGEDFKCPHCAGLAFYQFRTRPEVRKCRHCLKQVRLRAGTVLDHSKVSLLRWTRAIFHMMQGKRGVSALELKRHLGMKSNGTVWLLLQKIREALGQRDDTYKLSGVIELDGAVFGRKETGNQTEVLVAVESKDFIDKNGKPKSKAGFAKAVVSPEKKAEAQAFVDRVIRPGSMVNTDGAPELRNLQGIDLDYQVMAGDKAVLDHWLPWVHKLISNAKSWINGTHHGVEAKHLKRYMMEYFYRYNRRHDEERLFHRALVACAIAKPVSLGASSG